jgi:hypothetical protein
MNVEYVVGFDRSDSTVVKNLGVAVVLPLAYLKRFATRRQIPGEQRIVLCVQEKANSGVLWNCYCITMIGLRTVCQKGNK